MVDASLLAEVKNYLDITWDDSSADEKLSGQISRGIAYIKDKTGYDPSNDSGGSCVERAKELLLNYVLYDRSGALDQFKQNYGSDIVGLKIRWEVANAPAAES